MWGFSPFALSIFLTKILLVCKARHGLYSSRVIHESKRISSFLCKQACIFQTPVPITLQQIHQLGQIFNLFWAQISWHIRRNHQTKNLNMDDLKAEHYVQLFLFISTIVCYLILLIFIFYGVYYCCLRACILRFTNGKEDEEHLTTKPGATFFAQATISSSFPANNDDANKGNLLYYLNLRLDLLRLYEVKWTHCVLSAFRFLWHCLMSRKGLGLGYIMHSTICFEPSLLTYCEYYSPVYHCTDWTTQVDTLGWYCLSPVTNWCFSFCM